MRVLFFILCVLLWSCGSEKVDEFQFSSASECELFMGAHPQISSRYTNLECMGKNHFIFESDSLDAVMVADVEKDSVVIKQAIFDNVGLISFEDWKEIDSTYEIFMKGTSFQIRGGAVRKKNDSTLYILQRGSVRYGFVSIFTLDGKLSRDLFSFWTFDCCGHMLHPDILYSDATDSTIRYEFSTGDWVLYNEKKDEIRFSVKDPLHNYIITLKKKSGEEVDYTNLVPVLYCPGAWYGLLEHCYL